MPSAVGGRGSLSPPAAPAAFIPLHPDQGRERTKHLTPRGPFMAAEFPGVGPTRSGAEWGGLQRVPVTLAQQRVGLIGPVNCGS